MFTWYAVWLNLEIKLLEKILKNTMGPGLFLAFFTLFQAIIVTITFNMNF